MEINKLLTLSSNKQFIVLEKVSIDSIGYYYLVEYDNLSNKIKDNYKIAKVELRYGNEHVVEVTDEDVLKKILPMLIEKLSN
ncbi:MAG: hypothetical protein Q4G04_05620 [bacterium]|nr:hypothetical protein [bacterium]